LEYLLESAIRTMPLNVYSITYLVDLSNNNLSASLIWSLKSTVDKLGERYAERLHKIILINSSYWVSWLWSMLKVVLPQRIVNRYEFISYSSSSEDVACELNKYIDANYRIEALYGNCKYVFSEEAELAKEKAIDNQLNNTKVQLDQQQQQIQQHQQLQMQ